MGIRWKARMTSMSCFGDLTRDTTSSCTASEARGAEGSSWDGLGGVVYWAIVVVGRTRWWGQRIYTKSVYDLWSLQHGRETSDPCSIVQGTRIRPPVVGR